MIPYHLSGMYMDPFGEVDRLPLIVAATFLLYLLSLYASRPMELNDARFSSIANTPPLP